MKAKAVRNSLIAGSILLALYVLVGQGFVEYVFNGKDEIIKTADHINNLCNANGSCPLTLDGWTGENGRLRKGQMLYIATQNQTNKNDGMGDKPQSFKLIYVMAFPQDDWFEAQGGVGKNVTSGWTGR